MRSLLIAVIFAGTSILSYSQEKQYKYTVDLTNVVNDRVYVELIPPTVKEKEIIFHFPKIVPGTYAIADYGRYVADLKALDKKRQTPSC